MGMEGHASSCYCCARPSTSRATAMDIDAALNELGMLSTSTNSRREYVRERCVRREKTMSEPGLQANFSEPLGLCTLGGNNTTSSSNGNATSATNAPTPANSPSRPGALGPGYQIVCINPQFVTGLTASSPPTNSMPSTGLSFNSAAAHQPSSLSSAAASVVATVTPIEPEHLIFQALDFGAKYSQNNLKHLAQVRRTRQQAKIERLKRFKKPYDVPWRHQVAMRFSPSPVGSIAAQCVQGDTRPSAADLLESFCSSNASTPEKNGCSGGIDGRSRSDTSEPCAVTRSKSLDEIDFNKLRLAESVGNSYNIRSAQGLEVENMAHHLQNLQVNE